MCTDVQAHGWMNRAQGKGNPHSTTDTGGPRMRGMVSVDTMFCTIMFGTPGLAMCLEF